MLKNPGSSIKFLPVFLGAFVAFGLYASSLYSYLLFHSLVELFSVLVAFVIFVLAWNTRRLLDSHYLLFIGIASLCSGALDLVHILAYKGMGVFPGYDANLATQLWIAFRCVFSVSLLLAPLFVSRKLHPERALAVSLAVTAFLLALIFLRWFPDCFVEGSGLTPFKIVSEYVICLIFLAALAALFGKRHAFDHTVLKLMALSILSSIASELSFTQYASVYGAANMAGHFLEILSYMLIYRAIVVTGVVEPSNLLFRNLKQNEDALKESEARYRSLFENMIDGFAFHKIVVDEKGKPVDYVFLEVNSAFERLTGLKKQDIVGKRVTEAIPGIENDPSDWISVYGRVALTGKETRFEQHAKPLSKWFSVSSYSPRKEYFVAVFEDITERKLTDEALRQSEIKFKAIFENSVDAIGVSKGGVHIFVNPAYLSLFGYASNAELVGKSILDLIAPEERGKILEYVRSREKGGAVLSVYETRGTRKDGTEFVMDVHVTTYVLSGEAYTLVIIRDITERKHAEETLRRSHEELEKRVQERTVELMRANEELETEIVERIRTERQIEESQQKLLDTLESINDGFFTLDREWRFTFVNTEATRLWQRSREELIGKSLWDVAPAAIGSIFDTEYRRAVREKTPVSFEALSPLLGIWVEARAYPSRDGLSVYFHDITERKEAEESISRLNRLYSVLSKVSEAIVRIHNPEKLYERVCRIAVEDGQFKMAWIGLTDADTQMVKPVASYGDTEGYLNEIKVYASDASEGRGPTGRAAYEGTYSMCGDIEHDPRMLPWRDKALRHGFRSSAAFPFRAGSVIVGALTIYSSKPQFFTGEEIALLNSLAENLSLAIDSINNEKMRLEAEEAVRASSEEMRILYNNSRVTNDLLQLFPRKFSRKEYLDAAVILIREWSDCRQVGMRIADDEGNIPYESCAGYSSQFLMSESNLSLKQDHCVCTRVIAGMLEPHELGATTPNGSFYCINTSKFVEGLTEGQRTQYRGVCMKHGFLSLAVVPIRYRDRVIGAVHLADEREGMVPLKNVEFIEQLAFIIGEAVFRFGIENELKTLNKELEQRVVERTAQFEAANKELEAFAYSVSHDLRAPLRAIDGFSRVIEEEHAEKLGTAGREYFRRVRAAGQRMAQLIDAMLSLSRLTRGELNRIRVDLGSLAKTAANELKKGQPDRRVEFDIADGMTAEGDPVMLRVVVENLLENAWKFTSKTEKAKIEFGAMSQEFGVRSEKTFNSQLQTPISQLVYYVRDNGAGFDMTYANKLFMAFQRLHTADEFPGLGIGLATVQRIIHRHGGRIWTEGETGKGATFFFTLG